MLLNLEGLENAVMKTAFFCIWRYTTWLDMQKKKKNKKKNNNSYLIQ